ncbi:hypothetical protein GCM10020370_08400 [Paenibacillus hodogayensis]
MAWLEQGHMVRGAKPIAFCFVSVWKLHFYRIGHWKYKPTSFRFGNVEWNVHTIHVRHGVGSCFIPHRVKRMNMNRDILK